MKNNLFTAAVDKASKSVKNWWLLLVAGILVIAMGVATFFFPATSIRILSIVFGIVILLSGIAQLSLAITTGNYFLTRGYMVIGGILSILLGILFLAESETMATSVFPILMVFWLIYESFMIIGLGNDLALFRLGGSGWTIFAGALLLVLSIVALIYSPVSTGFTVLFVLVGISLIIDGAYMIYASILLKDVGKRLSEAKKSFIDEERPVEDAKIVK